MNTREFVTSTLRLLALEASEDRDQTATLLATRPTKELQHRGVLVPKLRLGSFRTGLGGRNLIELEAAAGPDEAIPSHRMRAGDLVAIEADKRTSSAAEGNDGADTKVTVEGVLYRVLDRRLVVSIDSQLPDELMDRIVRLVKVANDLPYKRMVQAVEMLETDRVKNHPIVDVVFGDRTPSFNQPVSGSLPLVNQALNPSQTDAIEFALSADQIALIHGPPGTGKTTTLVELILQLTARGGPKTHNIVERLNKAKVAVVRLGHPARVLPSILDSTLDVLLKTSDAGSLVADIQLEMDTTLKSLRDGRNRSRRRELSNELKALRKELRQREEQAFRSVIDSAQIVCTTLSGVASSKLRNLQFDYVCIDEVSQSLEAECWIAATRGQRLILCGDPMQLPPTIKSAAAASQGLERTLFDRLQKRYGNVVVRMLTIQYRMNRLISDWASAELYDGRLQADRCVADHVLADLASVRKRKPNPDDAPYLFTPLYLIDTAGCDLLESEGEDGDSKFNEGEAKVAAQHVLALVEYGVPPSDIAVITPYNAQVQLLQTLLKDRLPELEIGSVDGFQGREKEAIVLSLVRSNDDGEVGFLKEDRRLNVAVTRARRHVALICDSATMDHHAFLQRLCTYFDAHGDVTSAELQY